MECRQFSQIMKRRSNWSGSYTEHVSSPEEKLHGLRWNPFEKTGRAAARGPVDGAREDHRPSFLHFAIRSCEGRLHRTPSSSFVSFVGLAAAYQRSPQRAADLEAAADHNSRLSRSHRAATRPEVEQLTASPAINSLTRDGCLKTTKYYLLALLDCTVHLVTWSRIKYSAP